LVTVSEGFTKVIRNNFPIKYYGTPEKENNYVLSILPDKKQNRILSGTHGNGLMIFDTLQRLVKHISTFPAIRLAFLLILLYIRAMAITCSLFGEKRMYGS